VVSARNRKVSLADLAVLIHAVGTAANDENIGHLDCNRTLDELLRALSPFVWVSEEALESALFCANLQAEKGSFVDFRGNTFDQLVNRIGRFNKTHNYFTE
jgi:hypothetical protein